MNQVAPSERAPARAVGKSARELLLKWHRYLGLVLALFVIVHGLTGSVLAFHGEIDNRLTADVLSVQAHHEPLPINQLTAIVQARDPTATVTGMFFGERADEAYTYRVKPHEPAASKKEVWIDPYNGQIRGERLIGTARLDRLHLMSSLHLLHSTLLMGPTGEAILASVAACWFVTLLIGLYLAWSRAGSRWQMFAVKRGASRFRLWFDLHRAAGLVILLILLSTTLCATYLNAPNVFRSVLGVVVPTTPPVQSALPQREAEPTRITPEQAIARVQRDAPNATVRGIYFHPKLAAYELRARVAGDINVRNGTGRYFVDTRNGSLISKRSYREGGTSGDRLLAWMYPLHSGQAFGWFGRIVICLSGLVAPLLAISGIYIYLRKRLVPSRRKRIATTAG
ncbi:MAG TPA: PepSY-associated TM helix domain-containing protein [Rhodanobacter sp.]